MGKRLAESGYSVLVVNPFYRTKKAPTAEKGGATPIAEVMPLARALNETTHMTDAKAFVAWLDSQPSVAKNRKVGTQGYCMGGPMAFRTAAAVPERVGAVATFHGGGLVTAQPNSPHLQAAKSKAQFLVAIAASDDTRSPNDKTALKETFAKAEPARRDRGLHRHRARLVPARFAGLQRATGRKSLGAPAGALRQSAGLNGRDLPRPSAEAPRRSCLRRRLRLPIEPHPIKPTFPAVAAPDPNQSHTRSNRRSPPSLRRTPIRATTVREWSSESLVGEICG